MSVNSTPCNGKKRYDRAMAKEIARMFRIKDGSLMEAYSCRDCSWWHVGHMSTKMQLVIRKDGKKHGQ